jgi:hypothetical protein
MEQGEEEVVESGDLEGKKIRKWEVYFKRGSIQNADDAKYVSQPCTD